MPRALSLSENEEKTFSIFIPPNIGSSWHFYFLEKMPGISLISYISLYQMLFAPEYFSPDRWARANDCKGLSGDECAKQETLCLRGPMLRDLLQSYLLPKHTNREDVTLLPGSKEYETYLDGQYCDAYSLGMTYIYRNVVATSAPMAAKSPNLPNAAFCSNACNA